MAADRLISSMFSTRLVRAASARGVNVRAMWRVLGVEVREPEFPLVTEERHLALWAYVMRALDDPGFPIDYARTMSIDDYGVLGLACKTAPTLREALAVVEESLVVFSDLVTVRLERGTLVLERAGIPSLGYRCSIESALAELVTCIRQLVGELESLAVTFTHRAPARADAHRTHFGVAPQFGAARNTIELAATDLRRPPYSTDAALHRYLREQLATLRAAPSRTAASASARCRSEILRQLPRSPTIAMVARALGTSTRTLQRRLAVEGCCFEDAVDDARSELARALLDDRERTVAEVARACGFAEPSSFTRAFRRWTGRSPRAARRARQRNP